MSLFKATLYASALALCSTTAAAQSGNTVSDPSQSTGPRGITQQGTDPDGEPCTPAGANSGLFAYPPCGGRAPAGQPPPACSRTATDRCVQTYERSFGFGRDYPHCPNRSNPWCPRTRR